MFHHQRHRREHLFLRQSSLLHSVSNGGGCQFVGQTIYIQPYNDPSISSCLALIIVEVGWDSNDSSIDILAKESFSCRLHLLQNHYVEFLGSECGHLAIYSNPHHEFAVVRDYFILTRNKLLAGLQ
mmetsp:Transcript_9773/g.20671  ORF Transcript_9773/g.20671 Transcript_9773/m.20671 type:complete len:126 (-) Transcript_9773:356-733(-)